jgi:cytochrome P450 PksS
MDYDALVAKVLELLQREKRVPCREGGGSMRTAIHDDLFTPEVIADPYAYFDRLREEDPVHWNAKYAVWLVTRYDDVVWVLRHQELFSSEVAKRDPREPYPPIQASDLEMYNFVRAFFGDFFIQHDRPAHTEMRKVVHGYFTPKSMGQWRSLVQSAITDLLDEAEAQGRMDVMRDFATPLPLLVIAQMLGMPYQDRQFLRALSEQLLF